MKYDYLVVGCGLFGAVFANEAYNHGKKCLLIDKRHHIGGNAYDELISGIYVHRYGAHIFHTSNEDVWRYVNKFSSFNNFVNTPMAYYKGKLFSLPFNMHTFYEMWGAKTPEEAKKIINEQRDKYKVDIPANLEEQAINLVGKDIYEILIKGYTEKQWGRPCTELPADIIKRLPVRFTFNNNYFNDKYQGIPDNGYAELVKKLIAGIDIRLNCNYFDDRKYFDHIAKKIVFTGPIDEYYCYKYGALSYRSLRFETKKLDIDNYQGVAVVNYNEKEIPYTRIIEHKHFNFTNTPVTIITKEYPVDWEIGDDAYYPVNDFKNLTLFEKYRELAINDKNVIFGGRLGMYKYYDMDKVIYQALQLANICFLSIIFYFYVILYSC